VSDATLPIALTPRTKRLRTLAKRALQVFISYEVATYSLATIQAIGLSLPTMVNSEGAALASECDQRIQVVADTVARFRSDQPNSPVTYSPQGVAALTQSLPQCPDGGRFEVIAAGTTIKTERGTNFMVTRDRIVVRCVHEDGSVHHKGIGMAFSSLR
jgi:hypothetical protein